MRGPNRWFRGVPATLDPVRCICTGQTTPCRSAAPGSAWVVNREQPTRPAGDRVSPTAVLRRAARTRSHSTLPRSSMSAIARGRSIQEVRNRRVPPSHRPDAECSPPRRRIWPTTPEPGSYAPIDSADVSIRTSVVSINRSTRSGPARTVKGPHATCWSSDTIPGPSDAAAGARRVTFGGCEPTATADAPPRLRSVARARGSDRRLPKRNQSVLVCEPEA